MPLRMPASEMSCGCQPRRLGPPQPSIVDAGLSVFVPVPPGAGTVTVYTPAAGAGVNLAWIQSRTPTNLTADYALALTGQTVQSNIPAGANYLRVTGSAPAEIWCAWEA